jgi:large conductance mechanosensitive channel
VPDVDALNALNSLGMKKYTARPSAIPTRALEIKLLLSLDTYIIYMVIFNEFFKFLKTFGIIGLAIAFVIGQASATLVNALVTDIVNPLVGLFVPTGDLNTMSIKVTNVSGTVSEFKYGDLISNIIDFVIIAFIIFLMYRELSKYKLVEQPTK